MKTQLSKLTMSICDLAESLWSVLDAAVHGIWNSLHWRNISFLGKIILTAFILAVASLAAVICAELYEDNYGRYRWDDEQLSDNIVIYHYKNEKARVRNTNTGKYTTPKLDWVAGAPVRDTLTVYSRKGKRGFLNIKDGRIVIEAQYDKAWVFSDGLAAVVKDGKIGFINAKNEIVIPFRYDYAYRNGWAIDYLFRNGYCSMTDAHGACGLIDRSGNWIIEPLYDCIWTPHGAGYRIVKDGDKYGLLNPELQFARPIEYDYIEFAEDDAGLLLSQNGRKWQTDFDGNVIRPFVVDYTDCIYIPGTGSEEEAAKLSNYIEYRIDGRVGVLRRDNGRVVIPAIYESVNMLSETLFEVQLREDDNWILVDSNGNIVNN